MVLVDSTVWIDYLRGQVREKTERLRSLLEEGDVACTWVIVQEILQGAANPKKLEILRSHFTSLPQLAPSLETHVNASTLYASCRWRGFTIRSPHDCLIAQIAIEHEVPLLQDDADFERIALVEPRLSFVGSK
ncbi:MAG: type II toxin-antitoxin system VapC family toxin [Leptospirales bacterium]